MVNFAFKTDFLRIFLKILGRTFLILLAVLLLVWILIQTEPVQNFLVKKITGRLSKDLHTEVQIKHVSFTLFNRMDLDDILIRDQKKDTLLSAGALKVRISDWFFLKDNIELKYIGLEDASLFQRRSDSVWNFQFLMDYFSGSKKDTQKGQVGLNLKKVDFKNVHYYKQDAWRGEDMNIYVGRLLLDADSIDLNALNFKLNYIIWNWTGPNLSWFNMRETDRGCLQVPGWLIPGYILTRQA